MSPVTPPFPPSLPTLLPLLPFGGQTLLDFKNGYRTLMIATSVAGRGLDVKNLVLVVNYNCPNHLEDYIHRWVKGGSGGGLGQHRGCWLSPLP